MADFRVYYDAAGSLLRGDQVYGVSFGVSSGFYKYSPFAALFFVPLAVLPYGIASIIFYSIIVFSIIWFAYALSSIFETWPGLSGSKANGWILALSTLFMADHLERELHLGNVNLFLLIVALLLYHAMMNNKRIASGVLFGLLLLFKPHFFILAPFFIWKQEWRILFSTVIFVFVGFLLPAVFFGWQQNVNLHSQWFAAMRDHNVVLVESPNTVYGLVNHLLPQSSAGMWLVAVLLLLVAALFVVFLMINKRRGSQNGHRFMEFFILIALIPNLTHTDTEHFMWTWPLVFYAIARILSSPGTYRLPAALMVMAFIPYCVNSPDIVGRNLQQQFDGGLMGLANLTIIGVAVYLWLKSQPQALSSSR